MSHEYNTTMTDVQRLSCTAVIDGGDYKEGNRLTTARSNTSRARYRTLTADSDVHSSADRLSHKL